MRELEGRLSWREFQEWEIYLSSRPPDGEILDWQFSTLFVLLSGMFARPGGPRPDPAAWSVLERLRPRTAAEISADLKRQFGIEG